MQVDHLIVFHCQVVTSLLQMGNLHEVARGKCLADIRVVILGGELCADLLDTQAGNNPHLQTSNATQWRTLKGIWSLAAFHRILFP